MRKTALLLLLSLLLTLTACGGRQSAAPEAAAPPEGTDAAQAEAAEDANIGYHEYLPERTPEEEAEANMTDAERAERDARRRAAAEAHARDFLETLTLEEKVGQLFFACSRGGDMAEDVARLHLGGVLLFGRDFKDADEAWLTRDALTEKLKSWQDAAAADTGLPLFIGSDEEGGSVTRASRDPYLFPNPSKSPQALYAVGGLGSILNDTMQKCTILRQLGVNVNFAPVCDVAADPAAFIYDRTLGQDAQTTAAYVERVVMAMGDAGVGAVLKHFPGYGDNADTHTGAAVDGRSMDAFRANDFVPFRAGIEAGSKITPFVLVSHNVVTCMDGDLPASLSPTVHSILRGELGFGGVIVTDDLAMGALRDYAQGGSLAVLALKAGNDMLVTSDYRNQIDEVVTAVREGALPQETVDLACLRVLRAKAQRFDMPYETEDVTP